MPKDVRPKYQVKSSGNNRWKVVGNLEIEVFGSRQAANRYAQLRSSGLDPERSMAKVKLEFPNEV